MNKTEKQKILKYLLFFITIFFTLPLMLTILIYEKAFNKRINYKNSYFEYIKNQNLSIQREKIMFKSNKGQTLQGYFYSDKNNKKPKALAIFVHGMDVNHENYLGEINELVKNEYLVMSYDNTGVNISEGNKILGLSQGAIDLKFAIDYIAQVEQVKKLPKFLIGHSWGGFSVSAVNNYKLATKIDGIVNIAGFEKKSSVLAHTIRRDISKWLTLVVPYVSIYEFLIFGDKSRARGLNGLKKTDAKVLILHSKDDNVVTYNEHFYKYYNKFKNDNRFKFITYYNGGHRLTLLPDEYQKIKKIIKEQENLDENSKEFKKLDEERTLLIQRFNVDVIKNIVKFLDEIVIEKEKNIERT